MRSIRPLLLLLCLLLCAGAYAKIGDKPDPYEKIEDDKKAQEVFRDVQAELRKSFGFSLRLPARLELVHESVMDKLFAESPYKGNEVGLSQ